MFRPSTTPQTDPNPQVCSDTPEQRVCQHVLLAATHNLTARDDFAAYPWSQAMTLCPELKMERPFVPPSTRTRHPHSADRLQGCPCYWESTARLVLKGIANSPGLRTGLDMKGGAWLRVCFSFPSNLSQGIPQPSLDFQPKSCVNGSLCLSISPCPGLRRCHVTADTWVPHGMAQAEVPSGQDKVRAPEYLPPHQSCSPPLASSPPHTAACPS